MWENAEAILRREVNILEYIWNIKYGFDIFDGVFPKMFCIP